MASTIRLSASVKQKIKDDFSQYVDTLDLVPDGGINFSAKTPPSAAKATLIIEKLARCKIELILREYDLEVAWHGVVSRRGKLEFILEDIFVYPQEVTSVEVTTDQFKYNEWLCALPDGIFDKLKFHGHSHADMGVAPSTVDMLHREKIIAQLTDNMFYIFMIFNKSGKCSSAIYDLANNLFFESEDIRVVLEDDFDIADFLRSAKNSIKEKASRLLRCGGFDGLI